MQPIPSEHMFSYLPEQTGKNGCLEGWFKLYLPVWHDLIDQEEHPKREEKWDVLFQAETGDRSHIPEEAESIILNERKRGGKHHNTAQRK